MRGLYKGMLAPFLAQGVYKAVIFGANNALSRVLRKGDEPLSPAQQALCGSFAGGANAFVVTPVELVRNRLQVGARIVGSVH